MISLTLTNHQWGCNLFLEYWMVDTPAKITVFSNCAKNKHTNPLFTYYKIFSNTQKKMKRYQQEFPSILEYLTYSEFILPASGDYPWHKSCFSPRERQCSCSRKPTFSPAICPGQRQRVGGGIRLFDIL
jgi:hypothetical protein